jgi:hypothetical protein
MLLALLALFAGVPVVVFVSWIIDLWAKSYDFPRAQQIAKVALVALVTLAFTCATALANRALGAAGTPLELAAVTVFVALPIAALLWLVHDVDWRPVYAGAVVSPPATMLILTASSDSVRLLAAIMTAVAAVLAVRREVHGVRFARYARMLQKACSCCGYKQRAVHELYALGSKGRETILAFLDDPGSQYETRVRDEWESRCPESRS